jgi:hypothetical protein
MPQEQEGNNTFESGVGERRLGIGHFNLSLFLLWGPSAGCFSAYVFVEVRCFRSLVYWYFNLGYFLSGLIILFC